MLAMNRLRIICNPLKALQGYNWTSDKEAKISLQHSVWEICSAVTAKEGVTFSYEFINDLATSAFQLTGSVGGVLEYFAKHAKRHVITVDDIKLYFRSCPSLIEFLEGSNESRLKAEEFSEDEFNGARFRNHESLMECQEVTSDLEKSADKRNVNVKNAPKIGKRTIHKSIKAADSEDDASSSDDDRSLYTPYKSVRKNRKRRTCITARLLSKQSEAMEAACNDNDPSYSLKPNSTGRKPRQAQFKGSYKLGD